ncbi:MAG: DinB family protein [Dehalococcoidia bacterium]
MGARSAALADQFQQAIAEFAKTVETCSDAQWRAVCGDEGWSVAATAQHVAGQFPLERDYIVAVAEGREMPGYSWDDINGMNGKRADAHSSASKEDVLALLRMESAPTEAYVRGLSDQQLDRTAAIQEAAGRHGTTVPRQEWRIAQPVYVAETNEQALADIDRGATREYHEYFFTLGLKGLFEDYAGQPIEEITTEQLKRKMGWLVGDPPTVTKMIRELYDGVEGFGGILFITNDWADQTKWMKSMELFARYVMPNFQGTSTGLTASWNALEEKAKLWRAAIDAAGGIDKVVQNNLPQLGQDSIGRVAPKVAARESGS